MSAGAFLLLSDSQSPPPPAPTGRPSNGPRLGPAAGPLIGPFIAAPASEVRIRCYLHIGPPITVPFLAALIV